MARSGRLARWLRFWQVFPNDIIGLLCIGLVASGITMVMFPEGYRSFYLTFNSFRLTPMYFGLASVGCAAVCLGTRASYIGVALIAATFAGRGALLFTAWATGRVVPAPPATRWIWEVINMVIVLLAAGKIRRMYR